MSESPNDACPAAIRAEIEKRIGAFEYSQIGWVNFAEEVWKLCRRPDPAPVGVRVPDYVPEEGTDYGKGWTHAVAEVLRLNPQPGAVVCEAAMELVTAIRSGVPVGEGKVYFTARGMEHVEQCIAALLRTLTNTDKGVV